MEWFIVTNIHTLFTQNISVETWMGESIKTVLSFLPRRSPVSRCVVYLASVSVSGRTLDLSPRENLIVDVTFRLWQVLGNQWPVAGQVDNAPRHQTDTKVFHSHHAAVLRTVLTYSDTFLGGEQFTVKHSRWDHFEQVTSPRLPVTAALIDAAIGVKAPFYRNIQFVNFSQLERISLLNCWERGELSLTLDQVLRLIAAVIECFNCSRLHLNCDPCTTHTHTGVSAHFQPAPTLSFYRLFFSLFVVLATFISTAYHGRHQGQRCFTAKTPLPYFIDIHGASCYDDQDMIMQCRMLLRPFVWRPRVGGVFRPRCLYQ